MRVIAGIAKGRTLVAPQGRRVRPTTDRTKEALFSILQPELRSASVVDLYAGSGALGIEALSRGAARATFVERHGRAIEALERNLEVTGLGDRATVVRASVVPSLSQPLAGAPFDIAVLDPPYDIDADELAEVLAALVAQLAPGAHVTVELSHHGDAPRWPAGIEPGRDRRYGDTRLHEGHVAHDRSPGEPPT